MLAGHPVGILLVRIAVVAIVGARVVVAVIVASVRCRVVGIFLFHVFRVGKFVILLPLHASVLKPDFDLSFGEAQGVGYLDPPPSSQVSIKVKFFLQFQNLVPSISSPLSFRFDSWEITVGVGSSQRSALD